MGTATHGIDGPHRPRLFIGSSTEGKHTAAAIQANLDREFECAVWDQGLFKPGETAVEALDRLSGEFEFAVLVVTADDIVESRGHRRDAPRDNIVFEAGLFMGRLGRDRTFLVCPRDIKPSFPSDLSGLTTAEYSPPSNGNLRQALGAACTTIRDAASRLCGVAPPVVGPSVEETPSSATAEPRRRRRECLGTATSLGPKTDMRIVNISVTGALLETDGELPLGQRLDLRLQLDSGAIVVATATIVRVQHPGWRRVGGVGVTFMDLPGPSALALESFVEADSRLK